LNNNVFTFQTVKAKVKLIDSLGNPLSGGVATTGYNPAISFGTTDENGEAYKELLPTNIQFNFNYQSGYMQKKQDISVNPVVMFQTVKAKVKLIDSLGNPLSGGVATTGYNPAISFGTTDENGEAYKELLPTNIQFNFNYQSGYMQKKQDISVNPIVIFQ
jgi:hypothetical protein